MKAALFRVRNALAKKRALGYASAVAKVSDNIDLLSARRDLVLRLDRLSRLRAKSTV